MTSNNNNFNFNLLACKLNSPEANYKESTWRRQKIIIKIIIIIIIIIKSKLRYDRRSVGQFILVSSTHQELMTRFLLLSDNCVFVDVGRSLWRENVPAVYNCCWTSPAQSFLGPSPITVSDLKLPQRGGPGPRIYVPQEQGAPVIPPGTRFPFRRLLRLAGLRWRYSNPSWLCHPLIPRHGHHRKHRFRLSTVRVYRSVT
jgi:hypothetical protein